MITAISPNCKQIFFNIPVPNTVISGTVVTIQVTNGDGTVSNFPAVALGGYIILNVSVETAGVVQYSVIHNNVTILTALLVSTCEIDCCIAKLVESAINCTCHCDKCKEELLRAEKIHLLLSASKYAAEIEGNYKDAVAKYNKAKEFCTEVCACGC